MRKIGFGSRNLETRRNQASHCSIGDRKRSKDGVFRLGLVEMKYNTFDEGTYIGTFDQNNISMDCLA